MNKVALNVLANAMKAAGNSGSKQTQSSTGKSGNSNNAANANVAANKQVGKNNNVETKEKLNLLGKEDGAKLQEDKGGKRNLFKPLASNEDDMVADFEFEDDKKANNDKVKPEKQTHGREKRDESITGAAADQNVKQNAVWINPEIEDIIKGLADDGIDKDPIINFPSDELPIKVLPDIDFPIDDILPSLKLPGGKEFPIDFEPIDIFDEIRQKVNYNEDGSGRTIGDHYYDVPEFESPEEDDDMTKILLENRQLYGKDKGKGISEKSKEITDKEKEHGVTNKEVDGNTITYTYEDGSKLRVAYDENGVLKATQLIEDDKEDSEYKTVTTRRYNPNGDYREDVIHKHENEDGEVDLPPLDRPRPWWMPHFRMPRWIDYGKAELLYDNVQKVEE